MRPANSSGSMVCVAESRRVVVTDKRERKLPKQTLTGYSDPLWVAEPITISDWFQTPLESFQLAPIPPSTLAIDMYFCTLAIANLF